MDDKKLEDIYNTLLGYMQPGYCVPGIRNAFASGTVCSRWQREFYRSKLRIEQRLGVDEDEDLDEMRTALEAIQRELCYRMFEYGFQFGKEAEIQANSRKKNCRCHCRSRR